ncbi:hypothetical protein [Halorientalis pallida]|uniref:Uncharacterized protein n=1 Tax=Halorientalis pallida TaxID=2479928 RepID=A0A498KRN0_9EURY|nr:hypothetical protein [Halorientalis pallida]RXK47013.1 hypothetical protein EAF64_17900 [Halorientalis pallida]
MAAEDKNGDPPRNFMETLLTAVREKYIEEHGEEPPEEFMKEARNKIVHNFASQDRDEHRDIYDALASE